MDSTAKNIPVFLYSLLRSSDYVWHYDFFGSPAIKFGQNPEPTAG